MMLVFQSIDVLCDKSIVCNYVHLQTYLSVASITRAFSGVFRFCPTATTTPFSTSTSCLRALQYLFHEILIVSNNMSICIWRIRFTFVIFTEHKCQTTRKKKKRIYMSSLTTVPLRIKTGCDLPSICEMRWWKLIDLIWYWEREIKICFCYKVV
jgi:hypothetical protein